MNTLQRIAKNTLVLLISQVVSIGFGFLYIMYTAQYLGAEGFGLLSLALVLTGMLGTFAEMGLSQVTIRDIARDKTLAEKYVGNTLLLKLILSIFTLVIIFIVINLLNYPPKTAMVVFLIAVSVIIGVLNSVFYSVYQAFEKMEFQSIGQIINIVFLLSGAIILMYFNYGIIAFGLLYIIVSLINLSYNLIVSSLKFAKPTFRYEFLFWKNLLKDALPFAITGISINIYFSIDTVMLSLLQGNEVVGWYNAAYRLILFLLFIPIIVNNSVFPLMSQYFISSEDILHLSFEKLFKSMVYIGLPIGVGTIFIADKVILMIYGDQFNNSIIALQILVWSLVLIFSRSAFERLLESIDRQVLVTKIFGVGAVFNIVTNIILIPMYSYIGAGIATVLTDFVVLIYLIKVTKNLRYTVSKKAIYYISKIIFSCAIMGIFLEYSSNLNLFIRIICSAVIYILSTFILKILDEQDLTLIKSVFNKREKNEMQNMWK